jgi:tripartite-type tricarboxylate transporter receptor subunit TctC
VDILGDSAVQERMLGMGWQTAPSTPEAMASRIEQDTAMWGAVIDRVNAQN